MYTPTQVARRANVHSNSIRNWAREYGEFLSPQTSPRLFTDEDVQVLCAVAALRKSGVPPNEVAERIREREQAPPVVDATPTASLHEAPQAHIEVQSSVHYGYNAVASRLEALERRVDANRVDEIRQAEMRGATLALVAGGFVLWCLWLAANGL